MQKLFQAALAFGAVALALAPRTASASPADDAAIKAVLEHNVAAIQGRDVDGLMRSFAPDVIVFDAVPPRQYVGAAAFRKDWQDTLASMPGVMKLALSDLVVGSEGSLGYSYEFMHFSVVDPKGGKIEQVVRETEIYRKINGQWLIVHEHFSFPVDPATGKADFMSKP